MSHVRIYDTYGKFGSVIVPEIEATDEIESPKARRAIDFKRF